MAAETGGSLPPSKYYFGSRKVHPLAHVESQEDVWMPEEWSTSSPAAALPVVNTKPAPKNPWGAVPTPSKKPIRRGFIQRQPLESTLKFINSHFTPLFEFYGII